MCAAVVTRMMMCNLELFLGSRATLLSELLLYAMPASLTAPKLLSKISWGLDGRPIESTQQHEEAARQLDYLKGSTSHWNQTDARLTQEVNGVSMLQARDRIRAKMREAVAGGRACRRSKHQKALKDAAEHADANEKSVEASKRKNERVLRAVARLLEEKDIIASSAVVAQHNNLQLARELHAGEPDEELFDEAEDTETDELAARVSSARGPKADTASSTVPPHKRRRTAAPPHVDKADRIFEKAAAVAEQKALMQQAKEAADRTGLGTKGAALKTLLRRLCKHSVQEARQLEEKVDTWGGAAEHSAAAEAAEGKQRRHELGCGASDVASTSASTGPPPEATPSESMPSNAIDGDTFEQSLEIAFDANLGLGAGSSSSEQPPTRRAPVAEAGEANFKMLCEQR